MMGNIGPNEVGVFIVNALVPSNAWKFVATVTVGSSQLHAGSKMLNAFQSNVPRASSARSTSVRSNACDVSFTRRFPVGVPSLSSRHQPNVVRGTFSHRPRESVTPP